jgi:hypothetical protein
MNKRKYLLFQAWSYVAIIVAIPTIVIIKGDSIDTFGMVVGTIMLLYLTFRAYSGFKAAKMVGSKDSYEFGPPKGTPPKEHVAYLTKLYIVAMVLLAILEIWTVSDLNEIWFEGREHVRIWAPVAFVSRVAGYWPAVLVVPAVMALLTFLYFRKVRQLRSKE